MGADPEALVVNFRPMNLNDLDSVILNEQGAYEYPWSRSIFSDCMKTGYDCQVALLARSEEASMIVGHTVVSKVADEGHLMNLCVAIKHQSLGLGRQFLLQIVDNARKASLRVMYLEVRSSNRHAFSLYRSVGFNEIGRRKNYYPSETGREDALVMSLMLRFY